MKNILVLFVCILIGITSATEEGHEEHGENPGVGPTKGITAANELEGIKLSPEAIKNFELKTLKLSGTGPWIVPLSAKVLTGEERHLFRLRNGFYRKVDFSILSEDAKEMKMTSKDLKKDDEVVIHGVPFLRTAEISAFSGVPDEH